MSNPRTQEQYDRIIERLAIMEARADMPVRDGHPLWVPNPDTAEEIKRKARAVERIERMEGGLPAAPMAGTPALEAAGKVPGGAVDALTGRFAEPGEPPVVCAQRKWHDGGQPHAQEPSCVEPQPAPEAGRCDDAAACLMDGCSGPAHQPAPAVSKEELAEALRSVKIAKTELGDWVIEDWPPDWPDTVAALLARLASERR